MFLVNWPLIVALILVVVGSMFGLILAKSLLSVYPTWGSIVGSIINAIVILILEFIYVRIATKLTEWENWKYGTKPIFQFPKFFDTQVTLESEYENALILKRYLFEFANAYAALFYIAFLKTFLARVHVLLPSLLSIA